VFRPGREPLCHPIGLSTVCETLFRQRRKRIAQPLKELIGDAAPPEGVSPDMRAEEVSLEAFAHLADQVEAIRRDSRAMRSP